MKEHKIILPQFANGGGSIERPRERAINALARAFGGLTSWPAMGHWHNPETGAMQLEPVTIHAVAFEPTSAAVHLFREIGADFGRDAGQHSVYAVMADGSAEMIMPAEPVHSTGHYSPADLAGVGSLAA